ncbi:MAG: flavodoxin family protein [Actinobacteria bacterium]|nr:flavodoxin family protein [Actinomycetota bacterium]
MKVVAFNGSPRKDGNTFMALNIILDELKSEGIQTELFQLGSHQIRGCNACFLCKKTGDGFCVIDSDIVNKSLSAIYESDGLIIGSPTYFGSVTPQVKAFIDRAGYCARAGGNKLKRKVAASVAIARRAGSVNVCHEINNLFLLNQCIIPASKYWNIGVAREKGEILNDSEGIDIFKTLGSNMAWLLKKLNA